jgi:hypothetical protein
VVGEPGANKLALRSAPARRGFAKVGAPSLRRATEPDPAPAPPASGPKFFKAVCTQSSVAVPEPKGLSVPCSVSL